MTDTGFYYAPRERIDLGNTTPYIVERVDELPTEYDGAVAYFDEELRTLFVKRGAPQETIAQYMASLNMRFGGSVLMTESNGKDERNVELSERIEDLSEEIKHAVWSPRTWFTRGSQEDPPATGNESPVVPDIHVHLDSPVAPLDTPGPRRVTKVVDRLKGGKYRITEEHEVTEGGKPLRQRKIIKKQEDGSFLVTEEPDE